MAVFAEYLWRPSCVGADDDHDSFLAAAMTLAASALLFCLIAPPQATEEDSLRAAVQQYYDAQAARDPDRAASFWSPSANPRITRDTFLALFGPAAEDTYTVEIRSVTVNGADARVRVMWVLT